MSLCVNLTKMPVICENKTITRKFHDFLHHKIMIRTTIVILQKGAHNSVLSFMKYFIAISIRIVIR